MASTGTQPDLPIIFEDDNLLIVCKPANILSQGDQTGDPDVVSLVRQYLAQTTGKKSFVGLVHRLDRPVYGLLIIAKNSQTARKLDRQQRDRGIRKEYRAVVHGKAPVNGVWRHTLLKDRSTNLVSVVKANHSDGKEAMLSFQRLATHDNLSLLAIYLQTGRPHQIRVQCAHEGFPIFGDYKYGKAEDGEEKQIALYASKLRIQHPQTGEPLRVEAPVPDVEPWNWFKQSAGR